MRSEDRQLLLDALLAARDHLVITYSGRDERSNLPRPPAVPVGELLDVVDHTVRVSTGRPRDAVVVAHPLQPFDPRNFERNALSGDGPWSFDALHLAGAEAALTPRHAQPEFLSSPLPAYDEDPIGLDQLERFLRHPVRAFLRERLNVSLRNKTRDFEDAIPIDLDALEQWQIADRVLQAQLAGATQQSCLAAELARGALPPGSWPTRSWPTSPPRWTSSCAPGRAASRRRRSTWWPTCRAPGGSSAPWRACAGRSSTP